MSATNVCYEQISDTTPKKFSNLPAKISNALGGIGAPL